jgi:hypothetical protein
MITPEQEVTQGAPAAPPPRVGPRSELKFHLEDDLAAEVRRWCAERLAPDVHAQGPEVGGYVVESVYFDTPARNAFEDSEFPKYRARRYDGGDTSLHIEEKFSHSPKVWKRRQTLTTSELAALVATGGQRRSKRLQPSSVPTRLAWFEERFVRLELTPTLFVRYARIAFIGPDDLRVTLDREVVVAPIPDGADAPLFDPAVELARLELATLLEVKFPGQPPPLARELLEDHGTPVGYSKYRSGLRLCTS